MHKSNKKAPKIHSVLKLVETAEFYFDFKIY